MYIRGLYDNSQRSSHTPCNEKELIIDKSKLKKSF